MARAVVVGSGPNGLAAAVRLAQAGLRVTVLEAKDTIGGGTRSSIQTVEGLIHDDCSAFHPMGVASPFLRSLGLEKYGLGWAWPEVVLAHPLDSGTAGVLLRDLGRSAAGMGEDGEAWLRMLGPLARSFDALVPELLSPVLHWPAHPVLLARFGLRGLQPASRIVRRWRRPEVRALFGGVAAHGFVPLSAPMSGAFGLLLAAAGHACGWPVAVGGSVSIAKALAALLTELGGTIETGVYVGSLAELDAPDVVMLDVSPAAALKIVGTRLPSRVSRAYRKYAYGPSAFKVDFAVRGDVPWTASACRQAGTVHLGGTFEEVAAGEQKIARGVMPDRPFVLVGQQYLADPSRSADGLNPIWAYAHVPHGYPSDATEAIIDQVERFAPGFRRRIVARHVRTVRQLSQYNPNYVGGDISCGTNDVRALVARPRLALDPYSTGVPGVYLCSAATPPGAGVHGMSGYHAAQAALKHLPAKPAVGQ